MLKIALWPAVAPATAGVAARIVALLSPPPSPYSAWAVALLIETILVPTDPAAVAVSCAGAQLALPSGKEAVDGEFTTVEDVGQTALFLAAVPSNALTAQSVVVSHGWFMQ